MKKINIILGIPFLAILFSSCANEGSLVNTLQGKTKRETISVATKVPGRVMEILVMEGQEVNAGDTLAILDIPEAKSKLEQAEGALTSANAQYEMSRKGATDNQLRQLQAKYNGLEEQFNFAETSFERVKNMYQDSLISRQKYDETYAKFAGARAQLDAVTAELEEAKKGVRSENQTMALGQKQRASGAVSEVNTALKEQYVIAVENMTIETITLHQGELALPGYSIFNGYIPQSIYFRFTVPESKMATYKLQEEFEVELPHFNRTVKAKITAIKQLPKYADISTAFPNYELGESIYELKLVPLEKENTTDILTNSTVIIK